MTFFVAIQVYLLIGLVLMLMFDLMHYATRRIVPEEVYNETRYTNPERVYTIVLWPIVLYTLMIAIIKSKRSNDDETNQD